MKKGEHQKRRVLLFTAVLFSFIFLEVVSAADVAYIYKKDYKLDDNILGAFSDMGLSYDLVKEENILKTDFSGYRFIYVGDEKFKDWRKIPVGKYPTIVTNSYHGDEWGLVDDSIFQLAGSDPLKVKVSESDIIQVYTQAFYKPGSTIAIPYLYLKNTTKHNDMAPGLWKVVSTYQGNGYDLGAVIAYGAEGGKLYNNKFLDSKLCFFGISESDFWTPGARELFEDCIGHVAVACKDDSECPAGEVGERYCMNESVYQDVKEYECRNPGTVHSACEDEVVLDLVEECDYGCEDGECLPSTECNDGIDNDADILIDAADPGCWDDINDPSTYNSKDDDESDATISCYKNSDCGADSYGEDYCLADDLYKDYLQFSCNNPGLGSSYCSNVTVQELAENCSELCVAGECVEAVCHEDSDCGTDGLEGKEFCSEDDIFDSFTEHNCLNPGTAEASCAESSTDTFIADCGSDSCTDYGESYCFNGSVYSSRICYDRGCLNIGNILNPDAECFANQLTEQKLVESCDYGCEEGECLDPECSNTKDDDSDSLIDAADPGCWEDPTNPLTYNPEDDDEYDNFECYEEIDCGIDGYGDGYCANKSVYKNFTDYSCVKGSCENILSESLFEECSDLCIDGGCRDINCSSDSDCDDHTLYTYDKCNNPGTLDSYCTNQEVNCVTDYDCGITGYFGDEFCQYSDIYKYFQESVCVNAGTTLSYCNIFAGPEFLVDCGESYCESYEEEYCEGDDVYHSRECYKKGCGSGACFTNLTEESELVEECDYGCEDGECIDECSKNSDCGTNYYGENYCNGTDVYRYFHEFLCLDHSCDERLVSELVGECEAGCSEGECIEITCYEDSDCGTDGYIGERYCMNDSVYQNYREFSCNNPGLETSSCSNESYPKEVSECELGCSEGECRGGIHDIRLVGNYDGANHRIRIKNQIDEVVTEEIPVINCNQSVYDIQFKTENVGDFAENISVKVKIVDSGLNIVYEDVKPKNGLNPSSSIIIGNKNNFNFDFNPGIYTIAVESAINGFDDVNLSDNSAQRQVEIVCGECDCDEDCGEYYEEDYCASDDVYTKIHDFSCIEHGCYENISEILSKDCGTDSCGGWVNYCSGDDVYHSRECYEKGCSGGECFSNLTEESELVEECDYGCSEGECIENIACYKNSDCGADSYGEDYCLADDLYKDYLQFSCNNPGLGSSYCSNATVQELAENCSELCVAGECVEAVCHEDSDCGTDGLEGKEFCSEDDIFDSFTEHSCLNPGTAEASCAESSTDTFIADCGSDSCTDYGESYCYNGSVYSSRSCYDRGCLNIGNILNPDAECFANQLTEQKLVESCDYGCEEGECIEITCYEDSDCGTDSYIGERYCMNDSVYQNYREFSCNYPGLGNSYCSNNSYPKELSECDYGCSEGECIESECEDKDLDNYDSCNPGEPGDDGKPKDCDDNNYYIHPDAPEICNLVDDDCDGLIDEGNVCLPECIDGIDNDGDGKIDVLVENRSISVTRSWSDPFVIREFVNSKASSEGFKLIPVTGSSGAVNYDPVSAKKICNLAGYSKVVNYDCTSSYDGRCGWYSCNDNVLAKWDSAKGDFAIENACKMGNKWISSISCSNPYVVTACSDGIDNDEDGFIDYPKDSGCDSVYDMSEAMHDPECTDSEDDDESYKECTPGLFQFTSFPEIRSFVNGLGRFSYIPEEFSNAGALKYDSKTAQKICELKGYSKVKSSSYKKFSSCGDNHLAYWDSSKGDFVIANACDEGNKILDRLACENICS